MEGSPDITASASSVFRLSEVTEEEALAGLKSGKFDGAMVFPPNFISSVFGNGESGTFTKYNTADNNTELDSEDDDVAHVKLGGKWRMPTEYEWSVLKNKCNWDEWTDDFNGTGVKGNIVKAKNGNSIFLPAAGCYTGSYYDDKSSFGNYWTSSRNSSSPEYALYASFSSGFFHIGSISRASGYSVRPVWEE